MQLKQCSRLPSQGRVMSSPPPSSPFNGWNVDTRLNQLGPCGLGQHPKGSRTRKQKSLGASQLSRWGITQQIGLSHEKFHMRNLLTQLQVSITYIRPYILINAQNEGTHCPMISSLYKESPEDIETLDQAVPEVSATAEFFSYSMRKQNSILFS